MIRATRQIEPWPTPLSFFSARASGRIQLTNSMQKRFAFGMITLLRRD